MSSESSVSRSGTRVSPLLALGGREKTGRNRVAQAAAAEVDADPDAVGLIHEHVHVVVAAPDRAELLPGLVAKTLARVIGQRVPCR